MENKDFDKFIRDALRQQEEAPFDPADWDDLEALLARDEQNRRHLWIAKLTEVALMGLIALTFWQQSALAPNQAASPAAIAATGIPDNAPQQAAPEASLAQTAQAQRATHQWARHLPKPIGIFRAWRTQEAPLATLPSAASAGLSAPVAQWPTPAPALAQEAGPLLPLPLAACPTLAEKAAAFGKTASAKLASHIPDAGWRWNAGIGPSADVIRTPYSDDIERGAYAQVQAGFSARAGLSYKSGPWEWEIGAQYHYANYSPKPLIEITSASAVAGFTGRALDRIDLHVLQVPVRIRHYFANKHDWKIYATGGLSLDALLLGDNYYAEYHFSNGGGMEQRHAPRLLRQDGLLAGSDLIDNYALSASLGLGIEKALGERLSLFVEPSIQHELWGSGYGVNEDRLNSLALSTGVRMLL